MRPFYQASRPDWLNTFDARVDLGPTPFVLAGLIAFVIALRTVAGHAIKVAPTNPSKPFATSRIMAMRRGGFK